MVAVSRAVKGSLSYMVTSRGWPTWYFSVLISHFCTFFTPSSTLYMWVSTKCREAQLGTSLKLPASSVSTSPGTAAPQLPSLQHGDISAAVTIQAHQVLGRLSLALLNSTCYSRECYQDRECKQKANVYKDSFVACIVSLTTWLHYSLCCDLI